MLGDAEAAAEVLQDCFLRIWQTADRYDPTRSAPFTWCVMALRGLCLDQLRKRQRRLPTTSATFPLEQASYADKTALNEDIAEIQHAFTHLSQEEQDLLEAALFDPANLRQLADRWGLPAPTLRTRIHRAMLKIRHYLNR